MTVKLLVQKNQRLLLEEEEFTACRKRHELILKKSEKGRVELCEY